MIILSILRGVGAFFAALPEALAEAKRLQRHYAERYPYMADE